MILEVQCNSAGINNILYIIKNIMNLIMVIAPIMAIIAICVLITQLVLKPDEKKLLNKIKNATLALVIIFFIPLIVNVSMSLLGNKTNISGCYNSSSRIASNANYVELKDDEKNQLYLEREDYEDGEKKQLDFSCTSKVLKANFSCETIHIVEHHMNDFNYYTFNSVINGYGGFENYTKSLGGIYRDFYGEKLNVTKVVEFQRVSEYVFGYMTMYGFDYFSGKKNKYCKWGGGCMMYDDLNAAIANGTVDKFEFPTGDSDAFYPGQFRYEDSGMSDKKHFDNMVSGKSGLNMTTNCNWAVDMVYYKAGIFGTGRTGTNSSCNYSGLYKTAKKVVYKAKDLEVGDILAFFHSPLKEGSGPGSWGSWYHAAYVGETHKKDGYVVIYDGGSALTYGKTHKWKMSIKDKGDNSWVGFRVVDLM